MALNELSRVPSKLVPIRTPFMEAAKTPGSGGLLHEICRISEIFVQKRALSLGIAMVKKGWVEAVEIPFFWKNISHLNFQKVKNLCLKVFLRYLRMCTGGRGHNMHLSPPGQKRVKTRNKEWRRVDETSKTSN